MFQNLKQKTRNREDISKLLVRLMYKIALLEKEVSGGGSGGTPTLQQVTDEGAETTNIITLNSFGPGGGLQLTSGGLNLQGILSSQELSLDFNGFRFKKGPNNEWLSIYGSDRITINNGSPVENGIVLLFPYRDNPLTEETIATEEWVTANSTVDFEGYTESGTVAGGDLSVGVGNSNTIEGFTYLQSAGLVSLLALEVLSLNSNNIQLLSENGIRLRGAPYGAGQYAILSTALLNTNRTFELPDADGTIATEEWVNSNIPLTTTVEISSAQLLTIATTPVELISAQGAGKYIVLDNVISVYEYGTEVYDHDALLTINGGVFTPFQISLSDTESYKYIQYNASYNELFEDTPILLEYNGTPPTQGDGTLKLILTYRIITI